MKGNSVDFVSVILNVMHVVRAESDPLCFDVCSALSGAARFF